jgi:DNA-binding transcriptional LysR family regulator
MLKVTLEQWRMFKAVVDHGGFNQAAKHIHKSQSSIHTAVKNIENAVNVSLFSISGKKTELTSDGKLILRRAEFLLDEANKIEEIAKSLARGVESNLRISIDEIFPHDLIYKALGEVSARYPHLRIDLVDNVLGGGIEQLEQKKVDIAISPLSRQKGVCEDLCQIEFIAVACPEHSLHHQSQTLTLESLKSARQIVVRDSALAQSQSQGWLLAEQRWTVSHIRNSIDLVCQGFGFAWLPLSLIENELGSDLLRALPLQNGARRQTKLHLLFDDPALLGPAATLFVDKARELTSQG